MSIKRSSSGRQPARTFGGDSGKSATKIDKQALFEELQKRAASEEPFGARELATALGVTEILASKHLVLLSADGYLERVEGGLYRAGPMRSVTLAQFLKELQEAARNPQREKDLQDIARLRNNNDILREKLRAVMAERDRYLALLRAHGIDPGVPFHEGASDGGVAVQAEDRREEKSPMTGDVPSADGLGGKAQDALGGGSLGEAPLAETSE